MLSRALITHEQRRRLTDSERYGDSASTGCEGTLRRRGRAGRLRRRGRRLRQQAQPSGGSGKNRESRLVTANGPEATATSRGMAGSGSSADTVPRVGGPTTGDTAPRMTTAVTLESTAASMTRPAHTAMGSEAAILVGEDQ